MQKIFRKYIILIMSASIVAILIINFFINMYSLESQQLTTFNTKIDQIIHTMENNQRELDSLKANLDEDYLTRAKAAAYVVDKNPEVIESVSELQNLAKLLDVDELHIIDEKGVIAYSSVPQYIGLDFHKGEQTKEFLSILEDYDEDKYVIQESQPNAAEGKMMKYVGTARIGKKGIVQVGLEPVRQMEAQERNTYDYIFSRFPTDTGETFFALDRSTDRIIGCSQNDSGYTIDTSYSMRNLNNSEQGKYLKLSNEEKYYVVTRQYNDILIGISIPSHILFRTVWKNLLTTLLYLLFIVACVVLLLNYLLRRKVVNGIHDILADLSAITDGNLDTTVTTGGNPEFEKLSQGINTMVKSIIHSSDRLSKIIAISGIPLAAFEYEKGTNRVFVTSGLQKLLHLTEQELTALCKDGKDFYKKIKSIMEKPFNGENTIFEINEETYVRIHLSIESDGYLGVVTDATQSILEKKQMQYENNHDPLTGLFRYKHFKYQAGELLRRMTDETLCASVMLDLDSFKQINDTFGHDVGDQYLKHFADFLLELPKEHTLVCRRSGDEFCIFIFDCRTKDEIRALLSSFWQTVAETPVSLSESENRSILVSGGFSYTADSQIDLEKLMQQADEALYEAKRGKKGVFVEYNGAN